MKRLAAGLATLVVTATGCTHQVETTNPTPTARETTPTASTTAPAAGEQAPSVRDCYLLSPPELTLSTNTAPPVPCSARHTVATLKVVTGRRLSASAASEICRRTVSRHLGAGKLELAATMARWVWFVPADSSEKWVSCHLVVFAGSQQLLPLPVRTSGWYRRDPEALGICATSAPGSPGFERVICRRHHSWRVLEALPLAGTKYPGAATVRKEGDQRCADAVRVSQRYALKFRYGWEWPTAQQWQAGQHYGLCWTAEP